MGTISVNVDVDVDFSDIDDQDICYIIEERIEDYQRKCKKSLESIKYKKELAEFLQNIREVLSDTDDSDLPSVQDRTLLDDLYINLFDEIRNKFTLDEVEAFLKSK